MPKLFPSGTEVAEAVAKGDTETGIGVASDAKIVPGLDAIPFPSGAQSYSLYVAGVSSGSKDADAANALIAFAAGSSDGGRVRAGLRGDCVVGHRRTKEHARRDRGQAQ